MVDNKLLEKFTDIFEEQKLKLDDVSPQAVVACQRAEDYRKEEDPFVGENESEARGDLHCRKCSCNLAVSNFMYSKYQNGTLRADQFECSRCVFGLLAIN